MLKLPTLELVFSTYKLDAGKHERLYSKLSDSMAAPSAERGEYFLGSLNWEQILMM
jgi:hypothetical protein